MIIVIIALKRYKGRERVVSGVDVAFQRPAVPGSDFDAAKCFGVGVQKTVRRRGRTTIGTRSSISWFST